MYRNDCDFVSRIIIIFFIGFACAIGVLMKVIDKEAEETNAYWNELNRKATSYTCYIDGKEADMSKYNLESYGRSNIKVDDENKTILINSNGTANVESNVSVAETVSEVVVEAATETVTESTEARPETKKNFKKLFAIAGVALAIAGLITTLVATAKRFFDNSDSNGMISFGLFIIGAGGAIIYFFGK